VSMDAVRDAANVELNVPILAIDARGRDSVKGAVLSLLHVVLQHARERQAPAARIPAQPA
jgi:hypothetical protein